MKKLFTSFLRVRMIQHINRFAFAQSKPLNKVNFTTLKDSNESQIPEEVRQMMKAQKTKKKPQQLAILKDISEVKSMDQLPEIFKKMVFMTKQHREIAVRYLLSGIYQRKIPSEALTYKPLEVALTEYPHMKLETEIFRINLLIRQIFQIKSEMANPDEAAAKVLENKEKIKGIFNEINNLYYQSFNTTLKSIPVQNITRSKATLYKHFAEYNFDHLFDPTVTDKASNLFQLNESVLKKAREFLVESLKCHKQILLSQHKKLESDETNKLKEEDSERHQIKLNAIKENIRKIVESIGECLYAYFKVINKEHRLLKDSEEHKLRKIQLLSLIDTYVPFYSIVPGIKQISMMYYKIYKIKIEAKFTSVGEPKTQEEVKTKIKETVEDYNRLYRECEDCLEQSIKLDNFNSIKEISTTIISIKYMIGRTVKKSQMQIKNSLAQEAKTIIDKMKKQFKQPLQAYLMKIIKEMLNLKA